VDQPQSQNILRFKSNSKPNSKYLNSGEHLKSKQEVSHISKSLFGKKFVIVDDDSSESCSCSGSDDSDMEICEQPTASIPMIIQNTLYVERPLNSGEHLNPLRLEANIERLTNPFRLLLTTNPNAGLIVEDSDSDGTIDFTEFDELRNDLDEVDIKMANSIAQKIDSNSLFSEQTFKMKDMSSSLEIAKNCMAVKISSPNDYKTKSQTIMMPEGYHLIFSKKKKSGKFEGKTMIMQESQSAKTMDETPNVQFVFPKDFSAYAQAKEQGLAE
jgi:hypothetical protein